MQTTSDEVLIGRAPSCPRLPVRAADGARNAATAEDLISEVFLDVWRQADKFEGRSAVSTWILSIARFKALRRRGEEELDDETTKLPKADLERRMQLLQSDKIMGFIAPTE
jgi:RNA polymerase sigma-70 factor (ECF subfamily)